MQDEADTVYCVVDLHALTVPHDPEELRAATLSLTQLLVASGLDPERCTLFVQGHVREHAECAWVMECTAAFGELRRMTQFSRTSLRATTSSQGDCSPTRPCRRRTFCCTTPTRFRWARTSASTSS